MWNWVVLIVIAVATIAGAVVYQQNWYSPVILDAGWYMDFNGQSLKLRQNGTFRFCDICMGEICFQGHYSIMKDVIILDSASRASTHMKISDTADATGFRPLLQLDSFGIPLDNMGSQTFHIHSINVDRFTSL